MFEQRRYEERVTVAVDAATAATIRAVAKDAGASVASVARECIRRGLDPTREAWRKQKARRRSHDGAAGPDAGPDADAGDVEPDPSGDLFPTETSA